MDFELIMERGHLNVYLNGKFQCSCDSYQEAEEEIEVIKNNLKAGNKL